MTLYHNDRRMVRQPAVAGYFYPQNKQELQRQIVSFLPQRERRNAVAILVPHAGYMYSGHVAGEVYASVELPDAFIILCPNHTGSGSDFDVYPEGEWITPLGNAVIDDELVQKLLQLFPHAEKNGRAHLKEHSLEVQLPFLQYIKGEIRFLPVCIRQFDYGYLKELGFALAEIVQTAQRNILIIASSDMTHYESQESARHKDDLAIKQMERMDPRGLYDTVHRNNISMCGYLPATAALIASGELGATSGKLLKYATSGDITKDYQQVVGYAGMLFA